MSDIPEIPKPAPAEGGAGAPPKNRVKILVVDDEPDLSLLIRQRFRRQIRSGEIEFAFAGNGQEALEVLQRDGDIDIVLTDINMPVMDGLTLLSNLKQYMRLHKAVIVSAYGDLGNIRTAMNRGAFDFVTKPIDFQDLELTLSRTVDQLLLARNAMEEHSQLQALRRELDIASNIQQSILPGVLPPLSGTGQVEIDGRMIPALEVGGDFYDYFIIDDERIGFVIGDVSGKGISSALFMAVSRTLIKATGQTGPSASACITAANRMLSAENVTTMFVTAFYGILNRRTGQLDYCNAGHNPTVLWKNGQTSVLPMEKNLMLGIEEDFEYVGGQYQLSPGETVILYTDGVTEAENAAGNFYGMERLLDLLGKASADLSTLRVLATIIEDVQEFAGDANQSDDITVLALRWPGVE